MIKIKTLLTSLLLISNTALFSAPTPAGSVLENQVLISYQDALGNTYTAESNVINITIRAVQAAELSEVSGTVQEVAAIPHAEVDSVHRLQNRGNVTSTYQLTAANVQASQPKSAKVQLRNGEAGDTIDAEQLLIFHDKNGNGIVDPDEAAPITEITLAAGESANLIVRSTLPEVVTNEDRLDVTLQAKDKDNGAVTTSVNQVKLTFTDSNTSDLIIWHEADGGNCHAYKVIGSSQPISWTDAKSAADKAIYRRIPGHLLSINNAIEQMFIYSIIDRYNLSYWLGLSRDEASGSAYKWDTNEALTYTNWGVGEPTLGAQRYIMMWHGGHGKWYDKSNNADGTVKHYVIEFDTECGQPKIDIQLSSARDIDCDNQADSDFGLIKLAEMESGQCAIMDIVAVNDSGTAAKNMDLHHDLPSYVTYQAGSLQMCKGAGCSLVSGGSIIAEENKILFEVGDMGLGEEAHARFGVKID